MKTGRAFMVGGAAAAILTTGWALAPHASGTVAYASSSDSSATDSTSTDSTTDSTSTDSTADSTTDSSATDSTSTDSTSTGSTSDAASSDSSTSDSSTSDATSTDSTTTGSTSDTASSDSTTTDSTTSDSSADGTYTGEAVQTRYGVYQVEITVSGGEVTDVTLVQEGASDRESTQIKSVALPELIQEVLDTQSSDVSYISGASFTSQGFAQSVADAFDQAGL
ncbi:FMN-binding protein [Demequina salsinemoris]|uniref:FMN-binding protein n=1 Tax=Demequina salsinemoris TaxID=577470 RepID=UPI0007839DED|nr:FMN-binding protein [Demequina salsinemoris]